MGSCTSRRKELSKKHLSCKPASTRFNYYVVDISRTEFVSAYKVVLNIHCICRCGRGVRGTEDLAKETTHPVIWCIAGTQVKRESTSGTKYESRA
ncbi:hypothetical protein HOLleu_15293 [Holothuria leucospilota]|uniref:Uncharacterized protein n=1 Tax=Holothuria leucospilota TaxID=206669 RepID=A0A9Q1C9K4_HOLLE|nr:hypothetical protein HOLleu_15293 [Holothuria leucospilota]